MSNTDNSVEQHLSFPYKMPLRKERLSENIKSGNLIFHVQCDIDLPENLRENFANFSPLFKNINVGRDDIGGSRKICRE